MWSVTGSLNSARYGQTANLLPDGKVLVAGGYNGGALVSAELYDPATGKWTMTGSLRDGRLYHTATLLPDGMVLVAGGQSLLQQGSEIQSAEFYDPSTGVWTVTGNLNTARTLHTATLLLTGKVLAAGGSSFSSSTASAELYDPGAAPPTQISGRGSIEGQGDQARFTLRASQSSDRPGGSLSYSDSAAGISITKAKIRTLRFNGSSAKLSGSAQLGDGTKVTYNVSVTDNGSGGSSDTFSIHLSNGYSASGTLTSGDIQIQ